MCIRDSKWPGDPMKIYLAGPDVFLPDAIEVGRRKVEICVRHGLTGLYPLDNAADLSADDASLAIFKGNQAMMDAADTIIANLTPFRGPVSYTHLRAHETVLDLVCRLLLEKKKK